MTINWFGKLPHSVRAASGLEWTLWRKLPLIAGVGTVLPLLLLGLIHFFADPEGSAAQERNLMLANFIVIAIVIFHWSMVITVAIGCGIVMVMKGPAYHADSYRVSHADRPAQNMESAEDAAKYRSHGEPMA
jgi:hypothetical protein